MAVMLSVAKKKRYDHYASKPYTQTPDGLWISKEFNLLSPHSRCIFMIMLSKWRPYEPDRHIILTYDEIEEITRFNRHRISRSIVQLQQDGFIDIPQRGCYPKNVTRYKIEYERWISKKYPKAKPEPKHLRGYPHGTL